MKTYVASFINFFDNDLTSIVFKAPSNEEAYKYACEHYNVTLEENDYSDLESIKIEAFNQDCMINVICVD